MLTYFYHSIGYSAGGEYCLTGDTPFAQAIHLVVVFVGIFEASGAMLPVRNCCPVVGAKVVVPSWMVEELP